jgi:hypothetical protein
LLPGEPVEQGLDPRWQAIIALEEFIPSEPDAVWEFIRTWGVHQEKDLRVAVATCLLEHLLEHHFAVYFPRVEELAFAEPLFADTFLMCWKFGQSEIPANSARFDALSLQLRSRNHEREPHS